jgi:hypothetical protein
MSRQDRVSRLLDAEEPTFLSLLFSFIVRKPFLDAALICQCAQLLAKARQSGELHPYEIVESDPKVRRLCDCIASLHVVGCTVATACVARLPPTYNIHFTGTGTEYYLTRNCWAVPKYSGIPCNGEFEIRSFRIFRSELCKTRISNF